MDDIDTDQLLADIEKPSEERPMTGGESPVETPAAQTPEAPSWNAKEWEFDWNGRKVAPDSREKLMTWASQGHNYSQRMAEVNRIQREVQQERERYKGYDRYSEIDKYAKENKPWWDFVEQQYAQRSAFQPGQPQEGQLDPRISSLLSPLQQEIEQLRQWRETAEQEKVRQAAEQEDKALDAEIMSTREKHPMIDFDAVDPSTGKTLEQRICDHGVEIGTKSFRAAARDYLHDQLIESAKAQSLKAQVTKPTTKPAGTTATPTPRRGNGQFDHRGKSYDDITKAVMDEYGLNN